MIRRVPAVVAAVLVVIAIALFVVAVTNRPSGLLGADTEAHAFGQTLVVTVIASGCGCAAIVATMLAIGRRR